MLLDFGQCIEIDAPLRRTYGQLYRAAAARDLPALRRVARELGVAETLAPALPLLLFRNVKVGVAGGEKKKSARSMTRLFTSAPPPLSPPPPYTHRGLRTLGALRGPESAPIQRAAESQRAPESQEAPESAPPQRAPDSAPYAPLPHLLPSSAGRCRRGRRCGQQRGPPQAAAGRGAAARLCRLPHARARGGREGGGVGGAFGGPSGGLWGPYVGLTWSLRGPYVGLKGALRGPYVGLKGALRGP